MPKGEVLYVCGSCGQGFPRWQGQCPSCGEWNSLCEELPTVQSPNKPAPLKAAEAISITDVGYQAEDRVSTGLKELDRVLGGGIVPGSATLISGEPGIGKSTLMLQVAESLSRSATVLYISGEESPRQIRMRAERLGATTKNLLLLPETGLANIEKRIEQIKPGYVIIDSIQTLYRAEVQAAPGSVAQVRECAAYLVGIAKATGIPIVIVGHVTKEGTIAGPRVLEHVVDTVLYFEGEKHKQYRLLRAIKNRFGSTNEIGIFEMKESGLIEVSNPSEVFLSERPKGAPGSVVTAAIEGSRPLLVEIQALVAPTKMAYPIRRVTGVDQNRVAIILAVLERQIGLKLSSSDVYVNAAGGVRVYEPAIDLPIALAIASCYRSKPIDSATMAVGEIGLAGEIRSISGIEKRLKEAEKLGFKTAITPRGSKVATKLKLEEAATVKEALSAFLQ
ncbi:DNA repair protein RadA [candidate division WOR-1 bacterium RIFOXYA12_FULL_52_29]|uniref:DNA repair protein RadA n=1 Tax=candidate division WOR-1 bacterium RIFOXYC12_FULL_54_18 TaxID=1802584 RepID=A0A1F4T8W0_UNCSA|nr:MAG: DNA repair protein RadA [candidate division WOR-1 bacterium RIFOXYA2_FULL_51_19]OGC18056.1 MAG: DNA repair protein RadA [candidate division WOR-1 bacterium RIFOXYA12_FULL_52_29]OGC26912.1 MAG: DNA repair protein RadA [candidate division WOR-1 bacterium RIFOXYB2_FULL_45_9]OGC28473.1 MAG: DNA repair protein RadA [candidate division WOR-1 bacterium RIFOXYC12_FULL_54_18]OGC31072.1 MAG: DNA repair protein RadA [candidate division WOR-1 bacterium RIFOXYB12_FULL_52_16]